MRILLLITLVVVVVWAIRRALRSIAGRDEAAVRPSVPGELVSCARCGLHLPRTEARALGGALYCSEEHARLGAGPKG